MSSGNREYLLNLKKASIEMAALSGYDVREDLPVLKYKPSNLQSYIDYATKNADSNVIRAEFKDNQLLNDRSCLSTIYESKDRPNNFMLVCFVPVMSQTGIRSVANTIIQIPITICAKYVFSKQKYCESCVEKFENTKHCPKCPQQYCEKCIKSLKCEKCGSDKFCNTCVNKIKKMNIYKLTKQKCSTCTDEDYCEVCTEMKSSFTCKHCLESGNLDDEECQHCLDKIKCKECSDDMCKDCAIKYDFEKCKNCPSQFFCHECSVSKKIQRCEECPKPPQIIERCVIISEVQLSVDAKKVAITSIPRIRASTGELIEIGCLTQVFMDYEMMYNPLINSLGARYQVLTTQEAIDLFKNKDNNITESQIYQGDMAGPVSRYLGLFPGQVLRIEREILIPGTMLTHEIIYRVIKLIPNIKKNRRRNLKKRVNNTASGDIVEE